MVGVAVLVAAVLLAGAAPAVQAEVVSRVTIDAFNTVVHTPGETLLAGFGRGELDLQSTGNRDVRGRLQLRATVGEVDGLAVALLEVPRAEVRWRLTVGESWTPRFTAGRSRLTWGEGQLYNAGDVINGARPQDDLNAEDQSAGSADMLRDETQWLLAGYFPLGRFSFLELVALTADTDALAAGGRIQGQLAGIETEAGYLYRNATASHHPYLSAQGHLLLDWYGAATLEIRNDGTPPLERATLSAGALHTGSHPRLGGWSLRTEAIWSAEQESLSLFPEVTWSPSQLLALFARSEIDPGSTVEVRPALGVAWTPSTGLTLTLVGTASFAEGEGEEEGETGTVTAGIRYVF